MFGSSDRWLLHHPGQWADDEEFAKLGTAVNVPAVVNVAGKCDIKCITDFAETSRYDTMQPRITAGADPIVLANPKPADTKAYDMGGRL